MPPSTVKRSYIRGILVALPFVLVVGPFAMLFGVVATEAGLPLVQVMAFSALVIAGASQFAALQMMAADAQIWAILAAALAVNLRMAMYSASLVPWLGTAPLWQRAFVSYLNVDQSYAASIAEYEAHPDLTVPQRIAYFMGVVTPVAPAWYAFTLVGALVGSEIPPGWALDFALPITFLALIGPMIRSVAHLAAATVSVAGALAFAGLPVGVGLLLAGLAAMVTGAVVETLTGRRA